MMPSMLSELADSSQLQQARTAVTEPAKDLYFALYADPLNNARAGEAYLREQIAAVQDIPADLPPTATPPAPSPEPDPPPFADWLS